ncbi:MAG TPA: HYR domain-containing protein [Phycisphaerae bacterium]|nr:HYR domain-containing protein [Phycisphaerae bacterium]
MRASWLNRSICLTASVAAALLATDVTTHAQVVIDPVVQSIGGTRDPVPNRDFPFVFRGESNVHLPSINASGEVVFRARSASEFDNNSGAALGIYVQRPGDPLDVLVDNLVDAGTPGFAVPGRPFEAYFLDFSTPLINNNGDVVFRARFFDPVAGASAGIYATTTTGGPLVKIVDTLDSVPGAGGATFSTFTFSGSSLDNLALVALNNAGQLAFWAGYNSFDTGLFGSSVAGGPIAQLADNTTVPTGVPFGTPQPFLEIRPQISINQSGVVAFHGSIRLNSASGPIRDGVFSVPVSGGPPTTVAFEFVTAPDAGTATFSGFSDQEIDDTGRVIFSASLSNGTSGLYVADVPGGPYSTVIDTQAGGPAVPGDIAGAEFDVLRIAEVNQSGAMGYFATIRNSGTANNQGIYSTNIDASTIGLVLDAASTAPGLPDPARVTQFEAFSAAINEAGNMVFDGRGVTDTGSSLRGLYFLDTCSGQPIRIVDSTTSLADLGGEFSPLGAQQKKLAVHRGFASLAGRYNGLNDANQVAFLAQFSNFDFGIYVAQVAGGSGGQLEIMCPQDFVLECPADTSIETLGSATAEDSCSGGSVPVTYVDSSDPDCGGAEIITRTWTADDGAGNTASCDQLIDVSDTTAPVITCPADQLALDCGDDTSVAATGTATATDACGTADITYTDVTSTGCGDTVSITRSFVSSDECGNESGCDQLIATHDTTPPSISLSESLIEVVDEDCSGDEVVALPTVTTDDDCGMVTVTNDAPATFPAGEMTEVTFTATDECGNSASDSANVDVDYGSSILVKLRRYVLGFGRRPSFSKQPIADTEVCAYDRSAGSCAETECPQFFGKFQCIVDNCEPVNCATTDANGYAEIDVPPGKYFVIAKDLSQILLPDPIGHPVSRVDCGETEFARMFQIVRGDGRRFACRMRRFTGSELLVVEPEEMIWDDTQQEYPFVFESVGDWDVTVGVEPPDGFVADVESITENVSDEEEVIQFEVTEVGSDLIPTRTTFDIVHKGQRIQVNSQVNIKLTEKYARSRGFSPQKLRRDNLIKELPTKRQSKDGATLEGLEDASNVHE